MAGIVSRCPYCGASLGEPLGALGSAGPTCPECHRVANTPGHPYYGGVGAIEYDFDDVTPAERAEASDILIDAGVPYRWEDGYRLFVAPESEATVDSLFGQTDDAARDAVAGNGRGTDGDDEPAEWVADQEAVEALSRLFDAAVRLRHSPHDEDAGAELADAAGVVLIAPVPFAMNGVLWATAGMLARQLLELVEGQAEAEDIVAGAEALRAVLRDHV
jgi:hypothetical protein